MAADEVYQGPGIAKVIGESAFMAFAGLRHQGPAGNIYLWAGLLQGENLIYEERDPITNNPMIITIPVDRHPTPTLISLPPQVQFSLVPVVDLDSIQPGPVDAMALVTSAPNLDQSVWLLRAIWASAFVMQEALIETVVTNLTAVFQGSE